MTSQEVVSFVHQVLDSTPTEYQDETRRNIAKAVTEEALRRGSGDNVTVLVIWLHGEVEDTPKT
jgi:serine/threonine protein phosphatase PrpC